MGFAVHRIGLGALGKPTPIGHLMVLRDGHNGSGRQGHVLCQVDPERHVLLVKLAFSSRKILVMPANTIRQLDFADIVKKRGQPQVHQFRSRQAHRLAQQK